MTAFRLVPVLLLIAAGAAAQPTLVDEGTFTITRAGILVGTEAFKIVRRQGASGVEYLAQATRIAEGRVVKTALTVDSAGNPSTYSRTVTGSASAKLVARRSPGRLTVDESGERAATKDYLFGPGSLILDDDLLHQLYFVTWRNAGSIAYVAPGSRTSGEVPLVAIGREPAVIGKETLTASRYALGTGAAKREFWIDSNRRLLKVSIPSQQIEAIRELPPR